MFDKLIESDTAGAEFKDRRRYFLVSTVVVGILFLTAVVWSLYAAEIGIVDGNFDIAELLAPITQEEPTPDRPTPSEGTPSQARESELPVRRVNMARTDEFQFVPNTPSSEPNSEAARPLGRYVFDPNASNSEEANPGQGAGITSRQTGTASIRPVGESDNDLTSSSPPPVLTQKPPVKFVVSGGVVNGKATHLPVPSYPAPAKAVGAAGEVKIQVTIDEDGKVISAKAISGHPLLRGAAEKSAWSARFSPTYLSRVPVKVTGVIVYNFKRN